MFTACLVLTLILLFCTAIPLSRRKAWWVRGFDFPRLQFALFGMLLLALDFAVLDPTTLPAALLIGLCAACLARHVVLIVPYTRIFPCEVLSAKGKHRQRRISIMTANVLMPNRNAAALLELVRRCTPDVLVTLESDDWWEQRLAALDGDYPHTLKCPQDNLYGMHLYSRLPLEDTAIEYLVEADKPSMHALLRLESGDAVRLHCLHPAPPSPTENTASRERDAELIVVARSVKDSEQPVIVAGDLNDVAWSETTRLFRKISGLLDPRIGRGLFNTYHANYWFIRWPLDHLFHSRHFTLVRLARLGGFGSDHFALLTELELSPTPVAGQQGIDAQLEHEDIVRARRQAQAVAPVEVPRPGES